MSSFALKNCGIYLDGYDLSGDHNQVNLSGSVEILDNTTFQATGGSKTKLPGLKDCKFGGQGYVTLDDDNDGSDEVMFGKIGATNCALTLPPYLRSAGNLAYFTRMVAVEYSPGGQMGQLMGFSFNGEGHDDIVSGTILLNSTLSATGTGTAYNLGAVAADQYLYAAIHVLGVSAGDSIDLLIQSDDAEGFLAPTTRITFSNFAAKGSEWAARVAGPITDAWWRASYTINGASVSIPALVVMGIK